MQKLVKKVLNKENRTEGFPNVVKHDNAQSDDRRPRCTHESWRD